MSHRKQDDHFSEQETARRRDEVIRRMANTPPQPRPSPRPRKGEKAAEDRAAPKDRDRERA